MTVYQLFKVGFLKKNITYKNFWRNYKSELSRNYEKLNLPTKLATGPEDLLSNLLFFSSKILRNRLFHSDATF